jgi:hypothetical protein
MTTFKRISGEYIVTHNKTEYIFAHSKQAWAFIFTIKNGGNTNETLSN